MRYSDYLETIDAAMIDATDLHGNRIRQEEKDDFIDGALFGEIMGAFAKAGIAAVPSISPNYKVLSGDKQPYLFTLPGGMVKEAGQVLATLWSAGVRAPGKLHLGPANPDTGYRDLFFTADPPPPPKPEPPVQPFGSNNGPLVGYDQVAATQRIENKLDKIIQRLGIV